MSADRFKEHSHDERPSTEEYSRMNDREKDMAIQNAVIRLQNRIQRLLNLIEETGRTSKKFPKERR